MKVLGISGSLRKGSYNTALLHVAQELAPADMEIEIFDLSPIPLFNADLEAAGLPESVRQLRQKIAEADALLLASPEYNYSVTGVLKNAIDWASRPQFQGAGQPPKPSPMTHKPVAIMGAGGLTGTIRAQMHLRQILLHNDLYVLGKPEVAIQRAREKFDPEGRLSDEPSRQQIAKLLLALQDWTLRLKSGLD